MIYPVWEVSRKGFDAVCLFVRFVHFLVDISESIHTTTGLVLLGPNPRQLEARAMFHLNIPATTLFTPTTTSICKLGPFWPVPSTWSWSTECFKERRKLTSVFVSVLFSHTYECLANWFFTVPSHFFHPVHMFLRSPQFRQWGMYIIQRCFWWSASFVCSVVIYVCYYV